MQRSSFYIINAITLYRLLAAFVLFYFILTGKLHIFKWMLAISFLTDALDGFLARRFHVVSITGARIDSIADDLTMLMAILGIVFFAPDFIRQNLPMVLVLTGLYLLQMALALVKYGKLTSFHTYLAKCAAVLQAVYLILFFFLPDWPVVLFYIAAVATLLDLVEEIILVLLLPDWQSDVKGVWWARKKKLSAKELVSQD
jgi:phosphatidylglycerophosphate synthase